MRVSALRIIGMAVATAGLLWPQNAQDWTHYVRIGGHGLRLDNVDQIVQGAAETHVFGIEVDNDVTGRYDSFLDPGEKLKAIQALAEKAHRAGNYSFVYIAGTECITSNAEQKQHTMAKDHPDWLQRKLSGEPAVFGGGTAFWIRQGDEDVWLTPFARDWMKIYMERVRQIAATGIDGVYVDIPYWMGHFKGWRDAWASFDDHTVEAFRQKTGLDARKQIKPGHYNDPGFRKWIDFRIEAITNFMKEIDENVKSVNPKCKTIAEIYPGIEESAVVIGADVYELYRVVDTIAHEYSAGRRMSAVRRPQDWFGDMVGMYSFRAFAGHKPSWMLTYSWEKHEKIKPAEAMKNLFMAQLMAGTNNWDARGHVMSGSNDLEARKAIFHWIQQHEKTFYLPREPIRPIGVYFSPCTRNYFPSEFIPSYKGVMTMLLQSHLEFQVVTPRNLESFPGDALILPDVRCLSDRELRFLGSFLQSGKTLIVTGETGKYGEAGEGRPRNPVHELLAIRDASRKNTSRSGRRYIYYPSCPGKSFFKELEERFDDYAARGELENARFEAMRKEFASEILQVSGHRPAVEVEASPFVATNVARVNRKIHVFLANFKGLRAGENTEQIPERNVKLVFRASPPARLRVLPFLGQEDEVRCEKGTCVIPSIGKGAVVWVE